MVYIKDIEKTGGEMERGMEGRRAFSHNRIYDDETGLTYITLAYENREDPRRNIQIAVAPQYGSNLVQFRVGDRDIFYTDKEAIKDGRWTGCFVLWPLPNRYERDDRKEYEFEGRVVSLEDIRRKEGNRSLIHGLVDDQVWEYDEPAITKEGVRFATHITIIEASPLYRHFPYKSKLILQYALDKDGVEIRYTAANNDERTMPSVFALHPYYTLLGGREGTLVRVPAGSVMKATEDLLPTGELMAVEGTDYDLNKPKPVKGMMFDDVFTDLEPGQHAYIEYPALGLRVSQVTSEDFTHSVLFTQKESDLGFICLEPQTGATNAINLDDQARKQHDERLAKAAHVIAVPSGESHTGSVKFVVELIDRYSS